MSAITPARSFVGFGLAILAFGVVCTLIVVVAQKCTKPDESILSEIDRSVLSEMSKHYSVTDMTRDRSLYRLSGSKENKRGNFQYDVHIQGVKHRIFVDWRMEGRAIKIESIRFAGDKP